MEIKVCENSVHILLFCVLPFSIHKCCWTYGQLLMCQGDISEVQANLVDNTNSDFFLISTYCN